MSEHIALEGEVGSVAHGLGLPTSDCDLMRVEVETLDSLIGISPAPQTRRENPRLEGEKSQQGDIDITVHPLRKYLRLAIDGNPNVIPLLWTSNITYKDKYGLRTLRTEFITKRLVKAHIGFATNMLKRIDGDKPPRVNRPELIEEHGFDTKSAYHAVRVLIQAGELCRDGFMPMPMQPKNREHILKIRRGEVSLKDIYGEINELTGDLLRVSQNVPDETDVDAINNWLYQLHGVF